MIVAAAVAVAGFIIGGCGSSGGSSSIVGSILAPNFETAPRADLSGQADAFTGTLGFGTMFSFNAVQGVTYTIAVSSKHGNDDVVIQIFNKDGGELKEKSLTTNAAVGYLHDQPSQFVVVLVRPAGPLFDTGIEITQLRVNGFGPFPQTSFSVNVIVTGDDYSGFGVFNDLKTATDRAALTNAMMTQVNTLLGSKGFTITYEGFTLPAATILAQQPSLVTDTGKAIAHTTPEAVNPQGFGNIDTSDLDRWGAFGFPTTEPVQTRANGIDVFVIHHFETDGVVGLSPRPGLVMFGNGPGSALCIGAFAKNGNNFIARTPDQMGTVLTHELGHFLGLQHTTTFDPPGPNPTRAIDDGLSDTPAAGNLIDKNGDGVVGLGDGCADEGNIMFWEAGNQTILSAMQVNVIKATLSAMEH
jgi:hypothetical protein